MTSGLRRSGLSVPYLTIASRYGMRRKGGASINHDEKAGNRLPKSRSTTAKISSCVAKDISMSSW
jgi:ribosomal protein L14